MAPQMPQIPHKINVIQAVTYVNALQAVDKNTLLQLKGHAARGFAFDKYYGMDDSSDRIFAEVVEALVDNIFKVRAQDNAGLVALLCVVSAGLVRAGAVAMAPAAIELCHVRGCHGNSSGGSER